MVFPSLWVKGLRSLWGAGATPCNRSDFSKQSLLCALTAFGGSTKGIPFPYSCFQSSSWGAAMIDVEESAPDAFA